MSSSQPQKTAAIKPTAPTPDAPTKAKAAPTPPKTVLKLVTVTPHTGTTPPPKLAPPAPKQPTRSASYRKLDGRFHQLRQYLQMSEAALQVAARCLASHETLPINSALKLDAATFPELNVASNQQAHFLQGVRQQNNEYALIILCSHFEEYLKNVTFEILKSNTEQLVGKVAGRQMSYEAILSLGSYDKIVDAIVEEVSQTCEQYGANFYLKKLLNHARVSVNTDLLASAALFTDMRHALVHSSGIVTADFVAKRGDVYKTTFGHNARLGAALPKTSDVVTAATSAYKAVCAAIDAHLVQNNLVKPPDAASR